MNEREQKYQGNDKKAELATLISDKQILKQRQKKTKMGIILF